MTEVPYWSHYDLLVMAHRGYPNCLERALIDFYLFRRKLRKAFPGPRWTGKSRLREYKRTR